MYTVHLQRAISAASTLTLRYTAVLFTRFHPIGHIYLTRISANFLIHFAATILVFCFESPPKRRKSRPGLSLLLGWIDKSRPIESALTILLNLLCFGAVLDFLYRGELMHQSRDLSFSRVGYVDDASARIVIRSPSAAAWSSVKMELSQLNRANSAFNSRTISILSENDFVATFGFAGLRPETTYSYTTNASHSGTFTTAQKFPKKWSLISSSCIKPFYPYNPLDSALRIKGLEYLDQYISSNPVDMMLFLGDFIYIDLPIALGWNVSHYVTAYRQVYASPSWTPKLRSLPWIHAYDDHEIINDWSSNETGLYSSAMTPFWNYQGNSNPVSKFGQNKTHYIFHRGDVSLFMLDTRRYRSANDAPDGPHKTMLGAEQLGDLEHWLMTEKRWKVVISSVPFTRNWRGPDAADSWSGYLWERDHILNAMRKTQGVVIMSGDRHEHATTLFPAKNEGEQPVIEFSTSPLNQFYEPFDRFYKQIEDTDISIYSHPWGNSKFGAVTFNTSDALKLMVHYTLVVDGKQVWEYDWTYKR